MEIDYEQYSRGVLDADKETHKEPPSITFEAAKQMKEMASTIKVIGLRSYLIGYSDGVMSWGHRMGKYKENS